MSNREAKYTALMEELKWWGFDNASIEKKTAQALKTISHQLSWRTTMRIINALRRKRNVDPESDANEQLEESRRIAKSICEQYSITWDERATIPTINGKPIQAGDIAKAFRIHDKKDEFDMTEVCIDEDCSR